MAQKRRLDILLVEMRLAANRSKAAAMIMAAEVSVNEQIVDKPGTMVRCDARIALKEKPRYVGRGGLKLEAALNSFAVDPAGKVCADIGASTGGFTDCLLQRGAEKVYAIDVGSGIIDYRLRRDKRVVLMENTNARYLESLEEYPELVVADVSFISLRLVLPAITRVISTTADVIALVKPQFEAGRSAVGKGGIVRSPEVHQRVLCDVIECAQSLGFVAMDVIRSPITGAKGNIEFLLWLWMASNSESAVDIDKKIMAVTVSRD